MQISEDALMEKEQAVIREQQLNQEIGRLKKSLAIMLQEAGERTRNEVSTDNCVYSKTFDSGPFEIGMQYDSPLYKERLSKSHSSNTSENSYCPQCILCSDVLLHIL